MNPIPIEGRPGRLVLVLGPEGPVGTARLRVSEGLVLGVDPADPARMVELEVVDPEEARPTVEVLVGSDAADELDGFLDGDSGEKATVDPVPGPETRALCRWAFAEWYADWTPLAMPHGLLLLDIAASAAAAGAEHEAYLGFDAGADALLKVARRHAIPGEPQQLVTALAQTLSTAKRILGPAHPRHDELAAAIKAAFSTQRPGSGTHAPPRRPAAPPAGTERAGRVSSVDWSLVAPRVLATDEGTVLTTLVDDAIVVEVPAHPCLDPSSSAARLLIAGLLESRTAYVVAAAPLAYDEGTARFTAMIPVSALRGEVDPGAFLTDAYATSIRSASAIDPPALGELAEAAASRRKAIRRLARARLARAARALGDDALSARLHGEVDEHPHGAAEAPGQADAPAVRAPEPADVDAPLLSELVTARELATKGSGSVRRRMAVRIEPREDDLTSGFDVVLRSTTPGPTNVGVRLDSWIHLRGGVSASVDCLDPQHWLEVRVAEPDDTTAANLGRLIGPQAVQAVMGLRARRMVDEDVQVEVDLAEAGPVLRWAGVEGLDRWLHLAIDEGLLAADRATAMAHAAQQFAGATRDDLLRQALSAASRSADSVTNLVIGLERRGTLQRLGTRTTLSSALATTSSALAELLSWLDDPRVSADHLDAAADVAATRTASAALDRLLGVDELGQDLEELRWEPYQVPDWTAPVLMGGGQQAVGRRAQAALDRLVDRRVDVRMVKARSLALALRPDQMDPVDVTLSSGADGDALVVAVPGFGAPPATPTHADLYAWLVDHDTGTAITQAVPLTRVEGYFTATVEVPGELPDRIRMEVGDSAIGGTPSRQATYQEKSRARSLMSILAGWRGLAADAAMGAEPTESDLTGLQFASVDSTSWNSYLTGPVDRVLADLVAASTSTIASAGSRGLRALSGPGALTVAELARAAATGGLA